MIRSLYKAQEPFMLAPDGHGYMGVVMYDDVTDSVQCHICGKWFEHLGIHSVKGHKLSADEYKLRFGLTMRTALCGKEISTFRAKFFTENPELRNIKSLMRFNKNNIHIDK